MRLTTEEISMESLSLVDDGPLRVVIAEGHGLVRAGLRVLLETRDGIAVVGEAASADEAVAVARSEAPGVVLVGLELPGGGGGAGATGLLVRDADPEELVAAVRVVARGEAVLAPGLASRLVADFMTRPQRLRATPAELEELTAREREVVALVASGLSNEQIAEQLVVTRATAKTHVSRALSKLHARDRAQLVVLAYEAGLVRAGRPEPAASPTARFGRYDARGRVRRAALRPLAA